MNNQSPDTITFECWQPVIKLEKTKISLKVNSIVDCYYNKYQLTDETSGSGKFELDETNKYRCIRIANEERASTTKIETHYNNSIKLDFNITFNYHIIGKKEIKKIIEFVTAYRHTKDEKYYKIELAELEKQKNDILDEIKQLKLKYKKAV